MGLITYLWAKFAKKLPLSAIKNSQFEKPSKVEARSTVIGTAMGRYSYCGYGCTLINCEIGRFCSISDGVSVGLGHHPIDWVSTSPAFYKGKDSIPKNLATLEFSTDSKRTVIGNDVWIGMNVMIKDGVRIGDGAVIGMGSVVTKDVPPYAVVAGNPARVIKMRFSDDIIEKLLLSKWWSLPLDELSALSDVMNDPQKMLNALEKDK